MRSVTLALVALVASAAALALLAGYASVVGDRTSYVSGIISTTSKAIKIDYPKQEFQISTAAGDQGHTKGPLFVIEKNSNITDVKLVVKLVNANQIARVTKYFDLLLEANNQTLGYLSPSHPVAILTLDSKDFKNNNVTVNGELFYEFKEGVYVDKLPILIQVQEAQSS